MTERKFKKLDEVLRENFTEDEVNEIRQNAQEIAQLNHKIDMLNLYIQDLEHTIEVQRKAFESSSTDEENKLRKKLSELERKIQVDDGIIRLQEKQLADCKELLREGIKRLEEYQKEYIQIEGFVTGEQIWIKRAKGIFGET